MSTRDEQIDKMAAMLKEWAAETEGQRALVESQVADLRKRYDEAEKQMKAMRDSTEAASRDIMEGFQRMADDFMAALTKARDRF